MTETTIHFIRHGIVENPEEVYYGRLPGFRLGKQGVRQAKAAAKVVSQYQIAAVFSSPLERAIETAKEIVKQLDDIEIQISELLLEANTPFEGQPISRLVERNWDVYSGTNHPYEQPIDVLERAKEFVAKVRKEYKGQQVVATTHGDVIAFMIAWALGKPITNEQKQAIHKDYLGYASITSFTFETDSIDEIPEFTYLVPLE